MKPRRETPFEWKARVEEQRDQKAERDATAAGVNGHACTVESGLAGKERND